MKKLVALLVSCSLMSASIAANAASVGNLTGTESNNDNAQLATENTVSLMPCFRAGDTISFDLSGLSAGSTVTLISSKVSAAGAYSNTNVQYINQYDEVGENQLIGFTVRAGQEGIYDLKINDGTNTATFYYMVANPLFNTLKGGTDVAPTNYYVKGDLYYAGTSGFYNLGYVGTIEMGTDEVSLADAGVENIGFTITKGSVSDTYGLLNGEDDTAHTEFLTTTGAIESEKVIYYYGVELNRVPQGEIDNIEAIAVELDAEGNIVESASQAQ